MSITRKIDELGRIVIPVEIRNEMNISCGSILDIELVNGEIILHAHKNICCLCGGTENLRAIGEHYVCGECREKIQKLK